MAAYVSMFPQLVAGPIVRYADIAGELAERDVTWERFGKGTERLIIGLGKKVLLANLLGELNTALSHPADSGLSVILLAVSYTLQIYFDFSGYSDMAIGLGTMLGFTFPENFHYPLTAASITDFWRRWHMTLSRWFRDYLYIPLGGNRVSRGRWIFNLLVVWSLTGLWHGASWNFVLWGAFFGTLLIVEKLCLHKEGGRLPLWAGRLYTQAAVLTSFLLFSCRSLSEFSGWMQTLFTGPFLSIQSVYYFKSYMVVLALACLGATPFPSAVAAELQKKLPGLATVSSGLLLTLLFLAVTAMLAEGSFNPFLYFRF